MQSQSEREILERLERIELALAASTAKPLTTEEAAEYLRISTSHLYKLTSKGKIPHYKPEGKKVYFEKSELDAWLLRKPVKTRAEIDRAASAYTMKGVTGTSNDYRVGGSELLGRKGR
jgi:excisionase family DNA binding protein